MNAGYAGQESSSEYFYPPGKESTVIGKDKTLELCVAHCRTQFL